MYHTNIITILIITLIIIILIIILLLIIIMLIRHIIIWWKMSRFYYRKMSSLITSKYSHFKNIQISHTATWVGLLAMHQDREAQSRNADARAKITNFWFGAQRAAHHRATCACVCVCARIDFSDERAGTEWNATSDLHILRLTPVAVYWCVCGRIDFSGEVTATLRGWAAGTTPCACVAAREESTFSRSVWYVGKID